MSLLIRATLLKVWRLRTKSPWAFALEIFSTTSMLLVFFLIDRFQQGLFGDGIRNALSGLDTSYFGYVALGIAVSEISNSSLGGVLGQFQEDKRYGTMEVHIAMGLSLRRWAISAGAAGFVRALSQFVLIYGVAVGVLGLRLPPFRAELALLALACSVVPLWSLACVSLCSVLLLRRGNVFGFLISLGFELMSGVYVPLKVLPDWLRPFTELLPITPALRALQTVFYKRGSWADISPDLAQLLALGTFFLIAAWLLLAYTDHAARRKGHYALD